MPGPEQSPLEPYRYLEWEPLSIPLILKGFQALGQLPDGVETIRIERDEDYELAASYQGRAANPSSLLDLDRSQQRQFVRGFTILAEEHGIETTLDGCHIFHRSGSHRADRPAEVEINGKLIVQRVRREFSKNEPDWLTEWHLNGPHGTVYFPRNTVREIRGQLKRTRSPDAAAEITSDTEHWAGTSDHLLMEYGDRKFIVQKVNEFAPEWTSPLAIEYRREWGGIPPAEERAAVAQFLSFLFGRQLLKVGETAYRGEGAMQRSEAINPWGSSARRICGGGEHPPIAIGGLRLHNHPAERATRELLPRFIAKRDELRLSETLWRYWCSKIATVGLDLPGYYSALQGLAETWAAHRLPRANIKAERFAQVLRSLQSTLDSELDNALADLPEKEQREEIRQTLTQNLNNINRVSQNQAFLTLFSLLELDLGKTEKAAFKERHRWSHGSGPSDAGYESAVVLGDAYWAILSRVLLRLLEWDGEYVDHTQQTETTRPLKHPLGATDWVLLEAKETAD